MTLTQVAQRILANVGIIQVCVREPGGNDICIPTDDAMGWSLTRATLHSYQQALHPTSFRTVVDSAVIGEVTVACFRSDKFVVAVMLKTGHPVAKSLRRMVERAMAAKG